MEEIVSQIRPIYSTLPGIIDGKYISQAGIVFLYYKAVHFHYKE